MVAQASLQEPAVRHAVVAISSIYELVDEAPYETMLTTPKGRYAVVQYNQALQALTQMRDESVVLFVCILFICIEALRENKNGTITHCRYGIKVFNDSDGGGSAWARDYFRPIFVRLTSCPFFFGATLDAIPSPIGAEDEDISGPHLNWDVCRYRLDILLTRCIRFVREYELSAPGYPQRPAPDFSRYYERRALLVSQLADWLASFHALKEKRPVPATNPGPFLLMHMMNLVCKIWVSACGEPTEMAYDAHMATFREVVRLAGQAVAAEKRRLESAATPVQKPKFILEMGFIPTLYFVVTKCRDFELRQSALEYMAILAPERENLWNTSILYSVGKRIIGLEHFKAEPSETVDDMPTGEAHEEGGTTLIPPDEAPSTEGSATSPPPPPSELRVRDALVLRDPEERLGEANRGMVPHNPIQKVRFVMAGNLENPVIKVQEIAPVPSIVVPSPNYNVWVTSLASESSAASTSDGTRSDLAAEEAVGTPATQETRLETA